MLFSKKKSALVRLSVLSVIVAHLLWLGNWFTVNGTLRNGALCLGYGSNRFTQGFSDLWNLGMFFLAGAALFMLPDQTLWAWLGFYRCAAILISQGSVLLDTDLHVYDQPQPKNDVDHSRMLLVGLFHYAEVVLWFGVIFRWAQKHFATSSCRLSLSDPTTSLYYSMATATTLGYGDIYPLDPTGAQLVTIELVTGMFLALVVLARFVGLAGSAREKRAA